MAQRLGWIKAQPASWLSWEPVLAGIEAHRTVATTYPRAQVLVQACRPAETLAALKTAASRGTGFWTRMRYNPPLLVGTEPQVDMVWANMALHLTHLPQTLLAKWHRSLRVDGFLMFSCLGPDSLKELRYAYQQSGRSEPCHAHTDMHDWGDMLVQTGFAEPVMDMERITLSYSSVANR